MGRLLNIMQAGVNRLYSAEHKRPGPADDFWYGPVGPLATSGVRVTAARAEQVPVVFDCLKQLTDPIATLPLKIFRRLPDGSKEALDDHPLNELLQRPNDEETSVEFRGQMQWWAALYKNAYAEIVPPENNSGAIAALRPHHPDRVQVRRLANGNIVYVVTSDRPGEQTKFLSKDEMWHLKALPFTVNGLAGKPITETGRDAIGRAIAMHNYGARFFRNDATPGGVLEYPGHFATKEDKENYLKAWYAAQAGKNRGKIAVLEHGIKYTATSTDNRHAQFVEASKEANLDVARLWGMPPHMIQILDRAHHSNIEQQAIEFVVYTLLPWIRLWETGIGTLQRLMGAAPDIFAEFNVAGLLRGDLKTRYEAFAIGRQGGWLSVNDIRKMENMNEIGPDGDRLLEPLNMQPVGDGASAAAGNPRALNGGAALEVLPPVE